MELLLLIYYFTIPLLLKGSPETIELTSNQDENGVCIGDRVVFQCNVTGAGTLLWAVESLFSLGDIDLNVVDHTPGNIVVPNQLSELINVTLISVEQNSEHLNLGNLSSELTILVTYTTIGKHVYCSDTSHRLNESPSIIIKGHTAPSPVSNVSYGIEHYNIRLWIESHSDDNINYMLTLYKDGHIIVSDINTLEYDLNYTTYYSINISAIDCTGTEDPLMLQIIEDMVDCGVPMDNGNATINFTSTTLGSIATYQCRDNNQIVHCTEDGIWLPQLNITCNTTDFTTNVTTESSTSSTIRPSTTTTSEPSTNTGSTSSSTVLQPEMIVIIIVAVVVIIVMCSVIGLILIMCLRRTNRLKRRQKQSDNSNVDTEMNASVSINNPTAVQSEQITQFTANYEDIPLRHESSPSRAEEYILPLSQQVPVTVQSEQASKSTEEVPPQRESQPSKPGIPLVEPYEVTVLTQKVPLVEPYEVTVLTQRTPKASMTEFIGQYSLLSAESDGTTLDGPNSRPESPPPLLPPPLNPEYLDDVMAQSLPPPLPLEPFQPETPHSIKGAVPCGRKPHPLPPPVQPQINGATSTGSEVAPLLKFLQPQSINGATSDGKPPPLPPHSPSTKGLVYAKLVHHKTDGVPLPPPPLLPSEGIVYKKLMFNVESDREDLENSSENEGELPIKNVRLTVRQQPSLPPVHAVQPGIIHPSPHNDDDHIPMALSPNQMIFHQHNRDDLPPLPPLPPRDNENDQVPLPPRYGENHQVPLPPRYGENHQVPLPPRYGENHQVPLPPRYGKNHQVPLPPRYGENRQVPLPPRYGENHQVPLSPRYGENHQVPLSPRYGENDDQMNPMSPNNELSPTIHNLTQKPL